MTQGERTTDMEGQEKEDKPIDPCGQVDALVIKAEQLGFDRYIIAKDKKGFYLRKTLCITHRYDSGEVCYIAKPIDV